MMDALMDAVALLGRVSLFAGFSPQELEPLAAAARLRTFPKGSYIFHEGDPGNTLFVIRSGQVKIARIGPGGEEVVFAVLLPGDFFGEMALFDEDAFRTASAQAEQLPESLPASRQLFHPLLGETP